MTDRLGKKVLFTMLLIILLALPLPIFAQTAQKVENLLNRQEIRWQDAVAFTLEAADIAVIDNSEEAFQFAAEQNLLPKNAAANAAVRLNGVSLLLMKAFKLNGGLFYTLFKNPHHAYRELVYKDIIQGKTDPEMTVSGEEFLFMINRILATWEGNAQSSATESEPANEDITAQIQTEQEQLAEEINTQLETQQVSDTRASVTSEGVTISLSNIQFLANSAELTDPEKAKIDRIADILRNVPERNLLIVGHTAQAGIASEQIRTSLERAQSVADYLILLGIRNRSELMIQGFGSERPIADNASAEGMALNLRVEITILFAAGGR